MIEFCRRRAFCSLNRVQMRVAVQLLLALGLLLRAPALSARVVGPSNKNIATKPQPPQRKRGFSGFSPGCGNHRVLCYHSMTCSKTLPIWVHVHLVINVIGVIGT